MEEFEKYIDKTLENFKKINEILQIINDKINMLNNRVNDLEGHRSMNESNKNKARKILNKFVNEGMDSALVTKLEDLGGEFKRFENFLNQYIKGSNEKYYEELNNFIDKYSERRGANYEGRFVKRYLYNSGKKDGWEKLNDNEVSLMTYEVRDYMREVMDKVMDMIRNNKRK